MTGAPAIGRKGRPHAWIEVAEQPVRQRGSVLQCVIGRDLIVNPEVLSTYLFRELPARVDDLVILAGAVAFADRMIARRPAQQWGRDIRVTVPVHEPDFWQQAKIRDGLVDVLETVTGDCWDFEFRKRIVRIKVKLQGLFPFSYDPSTTVMSYSDGLDSLAVARIENSKAPDTALVMVTTGQRKDADREQRRQHRNARRHRVSIPFQLSDRYIGRRFREPSYRTRGFTYGVIAGIAAHLCGAKRVVVSESGQGALGPWMMPIGNEAPDVRTHPLFTHKLEAFLGVVLESTSRFEHPRLWFTKGQTLKELMKLDSTADWMKTRSCARDSRDVHLNGKRVQCGVCGACLLRRQSLLAAGLDEDGDVYLWSDLGAPTLADAATGQGRRTSRNDKSQAVCGALSMARLAALGSEAGEGRNVMEAAGTLAALLGEDADGVEVKLRGVLAAHRDEWQALVARAGPASFIAGWTEGVGC